ARSPRPCAGAPDGGRTRVAPCALQGSHGWGERAHRWRAAIYRGSDAPAFGARRTRRGAGDPTDATAIACRATRSSWRGAARRRVELFVSEQRLDQPNVRAVLEQMGCEGMTQRMKRRRLAQPRRFRRLLEQPAELARRHRLTISATGKQPALFRR